MMCKAYMNVIICLFRAVSLAVCVCEFVCVYQYGRERDRSRMGGTNQFNLIYFSLLVFFFVNEEEKINKKVVSSQYSSQNKTKKWRPIVGGYFHLFFSLPLFNLIHALSSKFTNKR